MLKGRPLTGVGTRKNKNWSRGRHSSTIFSFFAEFQRLIHNRLGGTITLVNHLHRRRHGGGRHLPTAIAGGRRRPRKCSAPQTGRAVCLCAETPPRLPRVPFGRPPWEIPRGGPGGIPKGDPPGLPPGGSSRGPFRPYSCHGCKAFSMGSKGRKSLLST